MPQEESKPVDPAAEQEALQEAVEEMKVAQDGPVEAAEEDEGDDTEAGLAQAGAKGKKKKSKKKKVKDALSSIASSSSSNTNTTPATASDPLPSEAIDKLSSDQLTALMSANPSLKNSLPRGINPREFREMLKKMSAAELATGMSKGKNAKDMASYKFWSTQPVPRFEDAATSSEQVGQDKDISGKVDVPKKPIKEGPIQPSDVDKVSKKPSDLVEGFEWSEMDLENEQELEEVRDLLCNHYVEDDEAMFRFNYSFSTLNWALKAPGWRRSWHVGVRATKSRKLVAFISAIPVRLRVRDNAFDGSEVNFLCVHKKLRSKRLAPVLIMEITRRCNLKGIFQAIYTAGVVLPKPVASCRYFHRALDWEKLYNVGFSPLPHNSTKIRQVAKYKLPEQPLTPGVRLMKAEDAEDVTDLLQKYLSKVKLAQEFNKEEVVHWLVDKEADPSSPKRVVWTYVVDSNGKITDFFSFYCLESTVIHGAGHHSIIRAAYLFYYGTDAVDSDDLGILRKRLNELVKDALILAKQVWKSYTLNITTELTYATGQIRRAERPYNDGQPTVLAGTKVWRW